MPDLTDDDRLVINNALARIGAGEVISLDDDSDLAHQALAIYSDRIDALLGLYDWSFAGKTYKLDAIAKIAENDYIAADKTFMTGWREAYALPGTRLGPPRRVLTNPRRPDDPLRDFFVQEGRIYADRSPLWAEVTVRVAPSQWLPVFKLAATVAVAADLCVPVTHDKNLAAELTVAAEGNPGELGRGGLIGKAIAQDAAGAPRKAPMWNDPLSAARLS